MKIGEVFRYGAQKNGAEPTIDGLPNFFWATRALDGTVVLLEKGINPIRSVREPSGVRLPALVIRSSPHRAGSASTPWQDFFDTDNGHIRYFGDNRADREGNAEDAPGNRLLNRLMTHHTSTIEAERATAVPVVLFRSISAAGRSKGQVEFQGFGLVERAERLTQWDGARSAHFTNYVFDIAVLNMVGEDEAFSWDWINARRTATLSDEECLRLAPASWRAWVRGGPQAVPRLRRSVAKLKVRSREEQIPFQGSAEAQILDGIVRFYHDRRARFEGLADSVAERVLKGSGTDYVSGWITPRSGDGGADFIGRLDVGSGFARTRLVVLGQAKCEQTAVPTGGNHIARTVARLRRGWLGVYVTTSYFSAPVQREVIDDQYPIVLIHGQRLAEEVSKMMFERGESLDDLLAGLDAGYADRVMIRRPEEILAEN